MESAYSLKMACMCVLQNVIALGQWVRCPWDGSDDDERQVKNECQATLRCFPFDQPASISNCIMTGRPAKEVAIFARAY